MVMMTTTITVTATTPSKSTAARKVELQSLRELGKSFAGIFDASPPPISSPLFFFEISAGECRLINEELSKEDNKAASKPSMPGHLFQVYVKDGKSRSLGWRIDSGTRSLRALLIGINYIDQVRDLLFSFYSVKRIYQC